MLPFSRRGTLLGLLTLGPTGLMAPAEARPKRPKIHWTILVPERRDRLRIETLLKEILEKETRKARWGKGFTDEVEATIDVRELSTHIDGPVARVTCSALGKIKGLGVARSRFSYGGKTEQQAQLEKHILELVARSIIVRLAELAWEKYDGWQVTR
ncbi:MAG: hypothetical protein RMJ98_10580 [Myxococcales bacterium]|nr:hypothetical protein [Polyangiaceae bacterium]MDW8249731.1 hypothetical protein [Myxococcales bacterium]